MAAELSARCFEEGEEQQTCLVLCTAISKLSLISLISKYFCFMCVQQHWSKDKNAYVEKQMLSGQSNPGALLLKKNVW